MFNIKLNHRFFLLAIFAFLSLSLSPLHAERSLLGYFHLINDECEPYGELLIEDVDQDSGDRKVVFNQYPIAIEIPEGTDNSYNDELIHCFCSQMHDLAKDFNVDSISLFIHASRISGNGFKAIAELSKKNKIHVLSLIGIHQIDEIDTLHIDELSRFIHLYLNGTRHTIYPSVQSVGTYPITY
ncbi:MAG TPA: hypothetical protein VGP47_04960 [Parachlamydiaceae bacterium]|nr:hypothetical protein [Parachlamydiaceae bacterium]